MVKKGCSGCARRREKIKQFGRKTKKVFVQNVQLAQNNLSVRRKNTSE